MMWINRKEWLLAGVSITLLIFGGAYYLFSPAYKEYLIRHMDTPEDIWESPEKPGSSALIIKVEGYANDDYKLKLDFYHKENPEAKVFKKTYSEIVRFPAGDINGTLKRDFYGTPDNSKVNITYIPENKSAAKGIIKLKVGIF